MGAAGVRAQAPVLSAGSGPEPLQEAAWRADLQQLRQEFLARDRAYSPQARAQAEARLALLEAQQGPLPWLRLAIDVAQIAALADNGHTAASATPRVARCHRVPIRLAPFGADWHVLRAREADADLLGGRLLAIDGVGTGALRRAAHSLVGGTAAWRDRQAPFLFECPPQLQTMGLAREAESALYLFESADGRLIERRLVGEAPHAERIRASTERLLLPQVNAGLQGWLSALPLERAPWSLRDAEQRMRWRHAAELNALVIDLRVNTDTATQKLRGFFDEIEAAANELKPAHLVLDLRQNGGGDLTRTRAFAQSLPALAKGRLFVLTSPWTFSAAISTAAYAKQAAPQRVTLVGEAAGDRLQFFAEGRPLTLKHSGLVLLPATERHDYRDGCRSFQDCHGSVIRHPIAIATLEPDIAAPWTCAAWREGSDPAMEAVASALKTA